MSMPQQHAGFFAVRVHHTHCDTAMGSPCCAEANLKTAAQAAARKALANVTTLFFDDAHPPARPSVWPVICSTCHVPAVRMHACQAAATLSVVINGARLSHAGEPAAADVLSPAASLGRGGAQNGAASPRGSIQEDGHSLSLVDYRCRQPCSLPLNSLRHSPFC